MDSRLFWLALAAFVGATEGGLIAGVLPSISQDMGVTIGQAGLIMVGYALAYAIGTPVLAVLLGGVGRRRILAWSELGLAVCALMIALAPVFPMIVGLRTVLAVCAGMFTGTAVATAAMIAPAGQRGRAIQIVTMGQAVAVLIGVPVGAYVAARFSWRINYAAIAAMAAAAALMLYLRLPKGMHGDTQTMRDRVRVLGNPGVVPALLVTMLFIGSSFPLLMYVGALMRQTGIALDTLPVVLLASGVGSVVSSLSAGIIADRLGNRVTVLTSTLMMIVGLGAFALVPVAPDWARLPMLLAIFAIQGYLGWSYWIAHCSQMAHLAPSSVPVAISLDMAALNIGMAIAAAAGGFVVDNWGASALPYAGAPFAVLALVIWLSIRELPAE
jgi:MFS transporter, DHA1 family, inner membrane transport protein